VESGNKRAEKVEAIVGNSGKMLSAILIGNNVVNLSASTLTTSLVIKLWGDYATAIATGVITLFVLVFGEISPKTLATQYSEKISLAYAPVIQTLMYILTPVIFIVDHLAGAFLKLFKIDLSGTRQSITEAELRTFVDVSHEDGVIEKDEKEIINNLFDFGDSKAKDVMIPRIDMTLIDVESDYLDVIRIYKETKYSRFAVYSETPDNVVGILYVKDLITAPTGQAFKLKNILREPFFVYEQKNTSDLFKEMQQNSVSIAIVIDEYGSSVGMITTEDLLEEIVGDIRDEYDQDEEEEFVQLSENVYRIDASYKLDDINSAIGSDFQSDDNDSIGGYITEKLDRIPKTGERFSIDNFEFKIESATKARIDHVIMRVNEKAEADT
jgi:CBS domain containing-hemolysin-like protein